MSEQKILKQAANKTHNIKPDTEFTEQEVISYLKGITEGEEDFESTLEAQIAENFVKGQKQFSRLSTQLEKQRRELKKGEELLIELRGRIDENARLLIAAFEERRAKKGE